MNTNNTLFNLKKIATGLVITAALGSFPTAFAAESIKASVNGMVCAFCAQGIEKRLSKMPATKSVFVDLKKKIVAIEAREGQTLDGKDYRRLGRWVCNAEGLTWRESPASAHEDIDA